MSRGLGDVYKRQVLPSVSNHILCKITLPRVPSLLTSFLAHEAFSFSPPRVFVFCFLFFFFKCGSLVILFLAVKLFFLVLSLFELCFPFPLLLQLPISNRDEKRRQIKKKKTDNLKRAGPEAGKRAWETE